MARTISAFDAAGVQDLHLDRLGCLAVADGLEDVRQRVIEKLRFWFGTWFLDPTDGVDYRAEVFVRPISAGLASALVTDTIRDVEGVNGVREVVASIDPVERQFTYSAQIDTPYGSTQVEAP